MSKFVYIWIAVKSLFTSCQFDQKINHTEKVGSQYKIRKIGRLPTQVPESSGLALHQDGVTFWTHNDSGGEPALFRINEKGALLGRMDVPEASNRDWEDLARGPQGIIFVGDIGNNGNTRKDLTIYQLTPSVDTNTAAKTEKIQFRYPDQNAYPPPAEELNFDCEAFFYANDSLYLFTKNRSRTKPYVKLYRIAATPGIQQAHLVDSLPNNTQITAADISPDGKTFALLSYGKILLFNITHGSIDFSQPKGCFRFFHKQSEALAFINNEDLMVTNEQGQIFKILHR